MMARVLDVVCPSDVTAGDLITVTSETGESFEVSLPEGVAEGQVFHVHLPSDGNQPATFNHEEELPGNGLGAIAAEMASARAIVADFFGGDPVPVENGEVLAEALRAILKAIERDDEVETLIETNSALFADYTPDGEQRLEWTEVHRRYFALVEAIIADELDDLECTAEEVQAFAKAHGADPKAERLLKRFMAMTDYHDFCALMLTAYVKGPMSV